MKKFFEKYDLIKISGIMVILTAIMTWLIPSGYFSGSEIVTEEIQRIGLTNFLQYGLLGMYYFTVLITFLFVMGGFYQVLSRRAGYQKLINNISEKLKGYEIPFVLIVSLLFAIASSIMNEYFPLLALVPLVIAILNRLKVDKISSFVATFGGILVGQIGSTVSAKTAGQLVTAFDLGEKGILTTQSILLVISFIFLAALTLLRMHKKNKETIEYDKFAVEAKVESKSDAKAWPYAIGAIIFILVTLLAYLPWESWEITLFTDITKWFNELSLLDVPIMTYIFGETVAFGSWDIFTIQFIMLVITVLLHWFGKVSLDEIFESYGEGFKKMGPVVVILLMVYLILEYAVMFPVLPTVVNWLANLTKEFNAFLTSVGVFITSLFSVEMSYAVNLAGSYYASIYTDSLQTIAVMFQAIFGYVGFFAPSSVILMLGLSYLNISYKDWMKFIWKFLVGMLVVITIIILIMA